MPTPSPSPGPTSDDDDARDRLALLERFLGAQLYSTAPRPPPPAEPAPAPAPVVEQATAAVSFRLFSSHKGPTQVTIREPTPPPLAHAHDPRIRAVEDEPVDAVEERATRIRATAVSGQSILDDAVTLACPHAPDYRLSTRRIARVPRAPATSTRERLALPALAYLNAVLPAALAARSPLPVPLPADRLDDAPNEPNAGLTSRGPYSVGKRGTGIRRRIALALEPGPARDAAVRLDVVPVLDGDRDSPHARQRAERDRRRKALDKERKKKLKLVLLAKKHGDEPVDGDHAKRRNKGRLSKERRERAKKRAAAAAKAP
ncbi:hypothetical protein JCM11491_004829 [Sporobolomyces phaffii]